MIQPIVLEQRLYNAGASPAYVPFGFFDSWFTDERLARCVLGVACTVRKFNVRASALPAAGTTIVLTVRKNAADTTLAVTFTDASALELSTGAFEASYAVEDDISIKVTRTGSPGTPSFWISLEVETADGSSLVLVPSSTAQVGAGPERRGLLSDVAWSTAAVSDIQDVMPCAGVITANCALHAASSLGHSFRTTIYLNGVAQDGGGGTPDTRCTTPSGTTGKKAQSCSLTVAAGDLVHIECSRVSGSSTANITTAFVFVATVSGESIVAGRSTTVVSNGTRYHQLGNDASTWGASLVRQEGGLSPFSIRKFYVRKPVSPSPGQYVITLLKSDVATAIAVTVTASGVVSDTVDEVAIADGNTFTLENVASGTAVGATLMWSAVLLTEVTIQGSAVFGVNTTVNATRAMAIGLDGNTNTLSEEGKFKVFGKGEFTDTVTLALGPAVAGVASAVDSEVALFDGTTGRKIKRATQTGVAKVASGVLSASNVNLASEVTGDLPFANLVQASAATRLVGRGSAAGAGDFQEITLGSGLSMSGTQLSATAGGSPGGGDGDSTHTAAYGSRPVASNDGDLFLPSNGFVIERDTGAAWVPWGPLFPFTAPVSGDFAWVNQGTATVSTTNGGIYMTKTSSAAHDVNVRKKAAPATPYTITAAFLAVRSGTCLFGLTFREAGTGELHTFGYGLTGDQLNSSKWTSPTAFSAHYTQSTMASLMPMAAGLVWLRIADDGSNRKCSISADGQNWFEFHTIGRTDFLTADEVGFFIHTQSTANMIGITLLSWAQG